MPQSVVTGVLQMECRDRYFMIAVDLSFAGADPRFEAVGEAAAASSQADASKTINSIK